jgi:hypothetical protein
LKRGFFENCPKADSGLRYDRREAVFVKVHANTPLLSLSKI